MSSQRTVTIKDCTITGFDAEEAKAIVLKDYNNIMSLGETKIKSGSYTPETIAVLTAAMEAAKPAAEGTDLAVLVEKAGGNIIGKACILAEGDAQTRPDIVYLEKLPLFKPDGSVME